MGDLAGLRREIDGMGSALVCFSGGFDSTFLYALCRESKNTTVCAFTADLVNTGDAMRGRARIIAEHLGGVLIERPIPDESIRRMLENGADRCYICKHAIYSEARRVADELGVEHVLCGDNADDDPGDRPGMRASSELGVESPLRRHGFTHGEIVGCVERMDLPVPMVKETCLLMRHPVGTAVTISDLRRVESIESSIRAITGLDLLRARMDGSTIRLQTTGEGIRSLKENEDAVRRVATAFGCDLIVSDIPYEG